MVKAHLQQERDHMALNTSTTERSPLIKWGAIAVIALMLLSGAAVYLASTTQENTTPTPDDPSAGITRTLVSNEVEATVKDLFPAAVIISQTSETDKSALDEAVGSIPGVRGIQSQFTKLDFNSGAVSYLGQVSLTTDANKELFIDSLFETGLFSSPEIYFQALMETPIEVTAVSEDGKSESVKLPSNQVLGYTTLFTRSGDKVIGPLQIIMQGKQVVNAFLFESQNVSQSPKPLALSVTAPVLELQSKLIVTGGLDYVPNFSESTIESAFDGIPSLSGVDNVIIPRRDNTLIITFPQAEVVASDVNAFIQSRPTEFVSLDADANVLFVSLGNISLPQAKQLLKQAIESSLQTSVALDFTNPQFQLLVDVNTSSSNTLQAAQAIENYFSSLDANAQIQSYQPGILSLSSLNDGNASYSIPDSKLNAYLLPGHAIGNNATVQVSATLIRDELVEASALETPTP